MHKTVKLLAILFLGFFLQITHLASLAQNAPAIYSYHISWNPERIIPTSPVDSIALLSFQGSVSAPGSEMLPVFLKSFLLENNQDSVSGIEILNPVYQPLNENIIHLIRGLENVEAEIELHHQISADKKETRLEVTFVPLRKNLISGSYERLISFDLKFKPAKSQHNLV